MNTKKSKFQQKLDIAVRNMKKKHLPEDHRGSINDQVKLHEDTMFSGAQGTGRRKSQTAQPPNFLNLQRWVSIKDEKPPFYSPINIWCGDTKEVLFNWARISNGKKDCYVNDVDHRVIKEISHWSPPAGVIYPKYDPMTTKDLPGHDLKEIIKSMKKLKLYYSQTFIDSTPFIESIDNCIKIVKERLKKVSKDPQVKLHTK